VRDFVAAQRIPPAEPVLLAGDFNLDLYDPDELGALLGLLGARLPPLDLAAAPYGYDGRRNALCRPGLVFWANYVLLARGHVAPAWARLRALPLRGADGRDLSDHYPVEGTFAWPDGPGR